MNLGPQGTLLSSAVDDPIQRDDPQMAVMLQHKSNLKTFVTKQSSIGKKKNAPIFACVNGRAPFEKVYLHLEKCRAEHNSSFNGESINALLSSTPKFRQNNENFLSPLLCLKQHIHKLGIGIINCSINISKDSCSGKLYTVSLSLWISDPQEVIYYVWQSLKYSQLLQQPRVVMFSINSSGFSYLSTQLVINENQPPPTLPKAQWPILPSTLSSLLFFSFKNVSSRLLSSETFRAGFSPTVRRSQTHKAQSILSTFPRILPSYMGSTVSSSQISSKTAPQANSSLAFLK